MSGTETKHLQQILETQQTVPPQKQQEKATEQAAPEQQRPQQQLQPQQVLQLPQNPLQEQQGFSFPYAAAAGNGLGAQGMQGSGYAGPGAGEGALMGLGIGVPMGMGLGMGMPMAPLAGAHTMYGARAMAVNPYGAPTMPTGASMPGAASLPGGTSSGSGGANSVGGGSASGGDQSAEEMRTLWVGGLQYWMDENYLWNCFAHTGELQSVKVIRNKATGYSEGYGFVEFSSHAVALNILQTYHGTQMLQCPEQLFRLNWASFGMGDRRQVEGPEYSIFVGDLANDVTDLLLAQTFRARYPSVKGAKVVTDNMTGRSKGYGFVRFGSEEERNRAMGEMNGQYCSSRPMRLGAATPKKAVGSGASSAAPGAMFGGAPLGGVRTTVAPQFQQPQQQGPAGEDPSNTTVFVGGLDASVTEDQLRGVFSAFGDIGYVKIPLGKGCGFVQFAERANAEEALRSLHGTVIGQQIVRLSWGRNTGNKQRAAGNAGMAGAGMQAWGAQIEAQPLQPLQQLEASFSAQLSLQGSPSLWAPQQQAAQQQAQGAPAGAFYAAGQYLQQPPGDGTQQPVAGVLAYAQQQQMASPFSSQFGAAAPFVPQQQQQQLGGAFQGSPFAVFPAGAGGPEQQSDAQQQPEASGLEAGSAVLSSSSAGAGSHLQAA